MTILEQAAECLVKGERYEVLGEVFKLIIPIYESAREFEVSGSINLFDLISCLTSMVMLGRTVILTTLIWAVFTKAVNQYQVLILSPVTDN